METISAKDLYEMQQKGEPVIILDVRTPKEYEMVHIANAMLHPIDEFDPAKLIDTLKKEGAQNPKVYVTCATGMRAEKACKMLIAANYKDVVLIEGGTVGWDAAGYPVERNAKTMPLQHQIKLFQGGSIVLGSLFAGIFSSIFILVPLFIGAEMIYSVKTGNSLWSGIFARMPWNL